MNVDPTTQQRCMGFVTERPNICSFIKLPAFTNIESSEAIEEGNLYYLRVTASNYRNLPNGDLEHLSTTVQDQIYEHVPGKGWKFSRLGEAYSLIPGTQTLVKYEDV